MPKTEIDYDNDGVLTSADDELATWDTNKDGKVGPKEEKAATAGKPGTQVTTTNATTGVSTTKIVGARQGKTRPKSATDFGVNAGFLKQNPDILALVNKAIETGMQDYDFLKELDLTPWGQARTKTQEAFDIASADPGRLADLNKEIDNKFNAYKDAAAASGINVSDDEIRNFARETVRSGLTDLDSRLFFASKFQMGEEGSATGRAATILADLQDVARSYGLGMDEGNFQSKIQDALAAPDYNTWLESQKNVFRQQAKNLYPTIGDQLDEYSYSDILDPYMNDAASVLGLNKETMDAMDPMWMTALYGGAGQDGKGGAPMSRDEWLRTLRTDKKYGFDRTEKARKEYSGLTDELFSAFGMA